MASIKNPMKYVEKAFKELGAVKIGTDGRHSKWRFPDGTTEVVWSPMPAQNALRLVEKMRSRLTYNGTVDLASVSSHGRVPRLDFGTLIVTKHARERVALMQQQGMVHRDEFMETLKHPDLVARHASHGTWTWVRGRLRVPIAFNEDGVGTITTVLWSTKAHFEEFPRPEFGQPA